MKLNFYTFTYVGELSNNTGEVPTKHDTISLAEENIAKHNATFPVKYLLRVRPDFSGRLY